MDKDEPFVYDEVDYKTPKQSPQTWPRDKIRQSRFQQKMSSLLSPATPKRDCSISNAKSLLLQCLRDAKSDPLPRRRFPVSRSDEGILMDGVLVTSATKMKVTDSPSRRSSIFRSKQHKDTEFSTPRSESERKQETTRSQHSSDGKGNVLPTIPCTPKAATPSKLQASAEPFILTPRQASPYPPQQLPCDHSFPQFPCAALYPYNFHRPRPLIYFYQRPPFLPHLPHGTNPYQLDCHNTFPSLSGNQILTRNNRRNSLPTTPSSSQPNTTTSDPPVHTPIPISTTPTADTSTTTTQGASPSADGLGTVTLTPHLSLPLSDGLETVTPNPDLSTPPVGLETVMPNLDSSSPPVGLETATPNPDLTSNSVGLGTMTINEDWSPSDDGLPTFTQAQTDFMNSHNRVLPDEVCGRYKFRKRMSAFRRLEEEEDDQ